LRCVHVPEVIDEKVDDVRWWRRLLCSNHSAKQQSHGNTRSCHVILQAT
jgi:hypothetical protein